MTRCSIMNCSNSTVNRGISFHRFPNDPHVKNKWIEATGRKKWVPTTHSRICSIHFHEDTFTGPSKYRRVISTAYPTIDVVMMSNNEKDINGPSTSDDEIPINTLKKKKILNQLNKARQMIKQKDKQIKCLKEQNRRKLKKIRTLVALLGCLKKKSLISGEQADTLKTTNVTSTNENELCSKQMKNTKGSVMCVSSAND